ncbi:MAG TPA: SirB2 family protein [Sphingomicrobium sp.]|nr:SirB2 family protein [Sphingomicrobium sp.]
MEPFYLEIRAAHIGAVAASGLLLLLRAVPRNVAGATWVMAWPVRLLSYTVDTVLLTAALMLTTIIRQYPFVDNWLTMKLLLLVLYIMLGYWALRGRSAAIRWGSLAGAGVVYAFIITVARAHSPLGLFA